MDDLDNPADLIDAFGQQVPFAFDDQDGVCVGWPARQDMTVKRVDAIRLGYGERDLIIVASSIPRTPRAGDRFHIDGAWWTVRPRADDCFTQSDRRGFLLRVYVIR